MCSRFSYTCDMIHQHQPHMPKSQHRSTPICRTKINKWIFVSFCFPLRLRLCRPCNNKWTDCMNDRQYFHSLEISLRQEMTNFVFFHWKRMIRFECGKSISLSNLFRIELFLCWIYNPRGRTYVIVQSSIVRCFTERHEETKWSSRSGFYLTFSSSNDNNNNEEQASKRR